MAGACAWVLNLDAELELGAVGRYQPSAAVARFVEAHQQAARALLASGDVLVRAGERLERPLPGRAWCPTPRALAALRAAGAEPEPAPPFEVLRAVNDRAFAARVGPSLPGAGYVRERAALDALLAATPQVDDWLLKRAFGLAGRGQRPIRRSNPLAADERWIERSLALGGLMVEPRVAIELEFSTHGIIAADGAVRIGAPCVQTVDGSGSWLATRPARADELGPSEADALVASAGAVGAALADAGYFGPFGLDAFRWRDAQGQAHLNPLSELNARYTMGWEAPS